LLDQIVKQSYEIKALAGNQVRIQPKTPDSYRAIIKALAEKNTAFHTYKLKYEDNYRVVLKNMHFSINPADIGSEIEKLGHTVTNIYNIKHNLTKLPLPIFFVDLKPVTNNKEIFNVEYLQQCKVKIEPPKQKRNIVQCANCQRYGHTKNYCHLKPRCVKCAGSHSTTQCPRKERSSDIAVSSVEETILPTKRAARYIRTFNRRLSHHFIQNLHSPSPSQTNFTYSIRSNIRTNHQTQFLCLRLILMMNSTSTLHFRTIIPNSLLRNKVMTFWSSKR
jgi:hypothetical protein